ncbi:MAG: hypothetical protein A2Y10_15300 [Planctomycetes bacterium GWF2_41_51]|nr:MAG: hypothetical protein A2Y10_15300 [Planctomycetes bacterium GWF2_41_51]HBG26967.1 hypothetical protein [Phycisphaerales bacterium]
MNNRATITKIAELANVSIGTVDRAVNDRPGINDETKRRILAIAKEYNYKPNKLSRYLARHRTIRIGTILLPLQSHFQKDVLASVQKQSIELKDFGVEVDIYCQDHLSPLDQVKKLDFYRMSNYDAIAIEPIEHPDVVSAMAKLHQAKIPVVTFNTDIRDSKRLCFIGQDLIKSGKIAAELLGKFIGNSGSIYVLHGYKHLIAHQQRLKGFISVIKSDFPEIKICRIDESMDNEDIAYSKTFETLRDDPAIKGIYVVATGSTGACRAIETLGKSRQIRVVCNDIVPETVNFIERGIIDATILQDPQTQGTLPLKILFDLVADGVQPTKEYYYTCTDVLTKYML